MMFGFPPILDGNAGVKLTNNADSGFPKPVLNETFYTIKDGTLSDATIWQTASGRVGLIPTANDDVYIRNVITVNAPPSTYTFRDLYISGTLLFVNGSVTLSVNNVFCDTGTLNMNVGSQLNIRGNGSRITKSRFLAGAGNVVAYVGDIDQDVLDLNYLNLTINSTVRCTKKLISNTVLTGSLQIGSSGGDVTFELGQYDLTVTGTTTLGGGSGGGRLRKSASGNVLFIGNFTISANGIDLSGNPNVECRGGGTFGTNLNGGTGTWTFTTNNQTINNSSALTANFNIIIGSGVTLTLFNGGGLTLNNTINGTDGTSKLLMGTSTPVLNFATQNAAQNSMTTGIVDFTTNANTVQFNGNYSATIPSYYTTFSSLTIGGTGTKTLSTNTTLNAALTLNGGTFELSTYNLTITGTSTVSAGTILKKSGAGSIIFIGQLIINASSSNSVDFSGGNPIVELRGGVFMTQNSSSPVNSGTGQWSFTTNNQTITNNNGSGSSASITFNCPLLISGAITLTIISTGGSRVQLNIDQPFNGNNAASTLSNQGVINFNTLASVSCMTTGVFDHSPTTTNTFAGLSYGFNGNYIIPYATMNNLYISGTGTKSIGINTTLNKGLTINASAILDLATYNLTVTGNTSIGAGASLLKTGSGSILFIGNLSINGGGGGGILNLSGNPNVEFRGGLTLQQSFTVNSGTGIWTFSTNNQSLSFGANGAISITLNCSILISGAVTLTVTNTAAASLTWILAKIINGDNANSKLLMGTGTLPIVNYQSATQPMATGILDTSTNLNTWIYGSGNQDIKGGASTSAKQVYRNLTLNGTGTKTLQGYVSVLNTYTLTSPATVNNNGFSITNP